MRPLQFSTFILIILISFNGALGQSANFRWAKKLDAYTTMALNQMVLDSSENVFCTGYFDGTTDFDPDTTVFNLISTGGKDGFICKLDKAGKLVWARQLKGLADILPEAIEQDASGNIYVTGHFIGSADMDPGTATINLNGGGGFLLKLNSSGQFLWVKHISRNTGSAYPLNLTIDGQGKITCTGYFAGTVNFNPGGGGFNMTSIGAEDIFIAQYSSGGTFNWARQIGQPISSCRGSALAADPDNNIYVTGTFTGTTDFNPGTGTYNLISKGGRDIFLLKLSDNGNFTWAKQMGGSSEDFASDLFIDQAKNLYLAGNFKGTADFDPDTSVFNLTSAGAYDGFVVKLDSSADFSWAGQLGGITSQTISSVFVDGAGNVYNTGLFEGTTEFSIGAGIYTLAATGAMDIFVSKIDPVGGLDWIKQVGGPMNEWGKTVVVSDSGNIYTSGIFSDTADFDPGRGYHFLTAKPVSLSGYVLKLAPCLRKQSTLNITACNSYQSPSGLITWRKSGTYIDVLSSKTYCDSVVTVNLTINRSSSGNLTTVACNSYTSPSGRHVWTSTGTYYDTIPNSQGCDSVITFTLFVTSFNTQVSLIPGGLRSNMLAPSYQWLNCDSNFAPIIGDTNQTFLPKSNGNYAVVITQNGCTDTSACVSVGDIGLTQQPINDFAIFPSPTSGAFVLNLGEVSAGTTQIVIRNQLGQEMLSDLFSGKEYRGHLNGPPGIYFIELISGLDRTTLKMVKK